MSTRRRSSATVFAPNAPKSFTRNFAKRIPIDKGSRATTSCHASCGTHESSIADLQGVEPSMP